MKAARRVAVLLFDNVEVLDFAGPFEAFSVTGWKTPPGPFDVYTVAASRHALAARNGLSINPDYDFATCPKPDVLVVPGGPGTRRERHCDALIDFVRQRAGEAEKVLSVCTGALLLAEAGLLEGLHATTHAGAMDELRALAPNTTVHAHARGVDNGKIVLSTGISAGIDMALYTVAQLVGLEIAIETAEYMQYDWRYREPDGTDIVLAEAA